MPSLLRYLLWAFARVVLPLLSRVRAHGLDKALQGKGPALVLPNHPAFIDPPLVFFALWPALKFRPLLFEGNFQSPVLYPLMRLLNALRVPDLDQTSAAARAQTGKAIE